MLHIKIETRQYSRPRRLFMNKIPSLETLISWYSSRYETENSTKFPKTEKRNKDIYKNRPHLEIYWTINQPSNPIESVKNRYLTINWNPNLRWQIMTFAETEKEKVLTFNKHCKSLIRVISNSLQSWLNKDCWTYLDGLFLIFNCIWNLCRELYKLY